MGAIVCATRGGQGSRAVQLEAIEQAKETGQQLIFLYVVDDDTIGDYDEELVAAIRKEFDWLGQALLRVARQRAEQSDVAAEIQIRHGNVRREIEKFLQDSDAELLLLGAPRGTTATYFGDDAIEQFAATIHEETGVKVKVVRPEY